MRDGTGRSTAIDGMAGVAGGRNEVLALRIPADECTPCELVRVKSSAAAFSDAIGGGLLDEVTFDRGGPQPYTAYLDEDRDRKRLPENPRARMLSVWLGWPERGEPVRWEGDVLIAGMGDHGEDRDVPGSVLDAARRSGILAAGFIVPP